MATRTPTTPLSAVFCANTRHSGRRRRGNISTQMVWTPISDATGPSRHLLAPNLSAQKQERRQRLVAGNGVWTYGCLRVYLPIL